MNNKYFFYALTILALVFTFYFLGNYISIVAASFLTVLVFNPVYQKLLKVFKGKEGIATALTIIAVILSFIIPLALVSIMTVNQLSALVTQLNNLARDPGEIQAYLGTYIDRVNALIQNNGGGGYQITTDRIREYLSNVVSPAGSFALNFLRGFGGSAINLITNLVLYIILLASIFPKQKQIGEFVKRLSPLDDETDELYFKKVAAMARSMVKGTFVIAFIQALIGGISLWIANVPYVFFLTVLLFVLSVIPLGSGIITIPAGIILILTGNVWQGIMVLLVHFFIVTNVDNIIRPKLVSDEAKLPEAIVLLSVFAGIAQFGPLGFIYGPVVMVLIYTTLEIYMKRYAVKSRR